MNALCDPTQVYLTVREQRMALVTAAARRFHAHPSLVMGECREQAVVLARWYAMALIRAQFGLSYPEIGRFFNKNHGTVMDGIARLFGYGGSGSGLSRKGMGDTINLGLALFGPALRHEAETILQATRSRHAAIVRATIMPISYLPAKEAINHALAA
jgi:hypothetical protein